MLCESEACAFRAVCSLFAVWLLKVSDRRVRIVSVRKTLDSSRLGVRLGQVRLGWVRLG